MKRYLGDGVYVQMEGLDTVLTTENGLQETNRIVLEPEVLNNLNEYLQAEFRAGRMHDDLQDS